MPSCRHSQGGDDAPLRDGFDRRDRHGRCPPGSAGVGHRRLIGHTGDTLRVNDADSDFIADVTVVDIEPSDAPPGFGYRPRRPHARVFRSNVVVRPVRVPNPYYLTTVMQCRAGRQQDEPAPGAVGHHGGATLTAVMALHVAVAEVADAEELAAVAARTFPLACPPSSTPQNIAVFIDANLSPARFSEYLADPDRVVLTAHRDGRIVGYAMLIRGSSTTPTSSGRCVSGPPSSCPRCTCCPTATARASRRP